MVDGDGTELKCVLPCSGSSECDCLSGWSVTQMNDISEVSGKSRIVTLNIKNMFIIHCIISLYSFIHHVGTNRERYFPIQM